MTKQLMKVKEILSDILFHCIRFISLALLVPSILVHEFGHFMAALLIGMRVEAFEIGKGDITYEFTLMDVPFRIREIPVGGGVTVNSAGRIYTSLQVVIMLAAGFLMNVIVALIGFLVVKNPFGWIYGTVNLFFAICSVWPGSDSDGYRCYQILRGEVPEGMKKCDE